MGKLDGKVALITGAGSGIGRATAVLFAKEGAKVVVEDIVPSTGQETVKMIGDACGQAAFVEADVSKSADVQRMIKFTLDTYGRLDILFNNAGILGKLMFTAELSEESFDKIIAVDLKGVFLGCKYAIPVMIEQGGGVIINNASTGAIVAVPGQPAYCAAKAGVVQLTKVAALEYADKNIRVNSICPGLTATNIATVEPPGAPTFNFQVAMMRMAAPEEIATVALFLASSDSSFVTGAAVVADGAWTLGPVPLKG